jgi:serine/threonine-protein kinase
MATRELAPETVVDRRYSILERIGSGGMADVYCAQDLQLGRRVALKLLYRRFAEDPEFVERFRREASAAAGLQHPNVVGVYDRGEWDGTYYIAMEYLEGRSLKQIITEQGPLAPASAIEIATQILRAARFAHQRGVIHRDLKPHNVIVDAEGRAKVTDFGIARAGASDMTETGSIMGTVQYLSPEQAQGDAVGAASDLYAVGIVLYEMLTGRVPFDGDSPVTVALKQVSEAPVPPSVYTPAVPPPLDAVVLRALEKDPAARFADADEFIAALAEVHAQLTAVPTAQATAVFGAAVDPTAADAAPFTDPELAALAHPGEPLAPEQPRRDRRRRWLVAALAVLLLAGGVLALLLTRPEKVSVPGVVGIQLEAASARLHNAGFEVRVTRVQNSAPVDRVLREDPQPGSKVNKGSTVTLTVSNGPPTAAIPDVTNLPRKDAEAALTKAGFQVDTQRESSETIPAGRATRTNPPGGQVIAQGQTVTLFVSSGPARVTVPAVTGQTEESAIAELAAAGLRADVSQQESDREPGTVLSQDPGAGAKVARGATVAVVVAKAPTLIPVPDVVGDDRAGAASTLEAAGFAVAVRRRTVSDRTQDGQVVAQSPSGGTRVRRGATVTITVGRAQTTTTPPNSGGQPAPPSG